jgi:hypothetical protein
VTGCLLNGIIAGSGSRFGRMRGTVAETTGIDPVTIKASRAFGMLLESGSALQVAEPDEPRAEAVRNRIRPRVFDRVTAGASR